MKLPKYDPPVTRADINAACKQAEYQPIEVRGYLFDCKPDDLRRMQSVGRLMAKSKMKLAWTLANDDDIVVSGDELLAIHDEIEIAMGERMNRMHTIARKLKGQDRVTASELWTKTTRLT